jgi:MFS family permease
MLGALYMASRRTVRGLGNIILAALFLFGSGLIAVSFSGSLLVAIAFLMIAGLGTMMHMASSNTIIQTVADDDKRGRVMSFYILSFSGFMPLGSLAAGYAAHVFGVRHVVACGGILTFLAGVAFMFLLPQIRRHLRPVYIKKGIIPVDPGVEIR